jgi:hypothetical protein
VYWPCLVPGVESLLFAGEVEAPVLLEVVVADNRAEGEDGFGSNNFRSPNIYCPRNGSWFALEQAIFPVLARSLQTRHYGFHRCPVGDSRRAKFAEP